MRIRQFRFFMLFVLLWNLVPGMAELSHGGAHQEATPLEASITSIVTHEKAEHSQELPCQTDCDDENCADHRCHFGHCRILNVIALDFSIQQGSQALFAQDIDVLSKELAYSLFKPPAILQYS